jgi:hypothetical protein
MAAAVIPAATDDVSPTVSAATTETVAARTGEVPEAVQRAESTFWRAAVIGVLVGMPVCALVWTGLVALAVVVSGAHLDWGVTIIMSVVVGSFAGVFFGGWVGVTIAAENLEDAEKASHAHA